jgi:hypothetical protein
MATFDVEIVEAPRPGVTTRRLSTTVEADTNEDADTRGMAAWWKVHGTPPAGDFAIRVTHRPKSPRVGLGPPMSPP